MKIIENIIADKRIIIVTHLHGNEFFGSKLFDHISGVIHQYPGLCIIIANEEAKKAKKRFLDKDLNRSFPGKINGNHEEILAHKILKVVSDYKYLIDIHTTTSPLKLLPIVICLNKGTERLINLTDSSEVVVMPGRKDSLIGSHPMAVSLEINEEYAETNGIAEVLEILDRIIFKKTKKPVRRAVYVTEGVIPLDFKMPEFAKNFVYYENLGYPYLLYEKNYIEYQGFYSKNKHTKII